MKKHSILIAIATVMSALALFGLIACSEDTPAPTAPPQAEPLAAPVITLTDNVVEWEAVDHAVSYSVYVGSDAAVTVNATSYTVEKTEPGAYDIYVIANASSSGEYKNSEKSKTVTYEVFAPEEVALVKLRLVNNPDKLDYFLDEVKGGAEIDTTGLVVNAVYSNGSVKKVTPAIGQIDFSTAGNKTVTLSYTEDERTAKTTFVITVRRRTEADIQNLVTLKHEFTAAGDYKIADGAVTAVDMDGAAVAVKTAGGISTVAFQKSGVKLLKVTDGESVSFVKVCAAIYITDAAGFRAMNDDLGAYYLLRNNIEFEGWSDTIGVAPLRAAASPTEFGDERGYTYDEGGAAQEGEPFTGTFDGDGYVVAGYKHGSNEVYYTANAYFVGIFGYIGEGGRVCNFVLRNAFIDAGKCSAIVAGVNLGTIENVTIEDDCSLYVNFNGGAAVAGYNGGTINNVVCAPAQYTSNTAYGSGSGPLVIAYESADGATKTNAYIADDSDLTSVLGSGWYYHELVGTVYCNESYKKVLSAPTSMTVGVTAEFSIFQRTSEDIVFLAYYAGHDGADEDLLGFEGYDASTSTYTLRLNAISADSFNLVIRAGSAAFVTINIAVV